MENSTLYLVPPQPIITKRGMIDYVQDLYHMPSCIKFRPPKWEKYNHSVTLLCLPFIRALAAKPADGPRRPVAQNARNLPRTCF